MIRRIAVWVDERTGLRQIVTTALEGSVPSRYAWLKTTGFACLALVIVECFTGLALSFEYSPSPNTAYASITHIEQSSLGRFTRGMHHWVSAELILLAALTVVRLLVMTGYRKRNDIVWLAVLIFAQLALFFQLTGHLLPWDTNGVATAQVESGFAGNVWVVGAPVKRIILGGGAVGAPTLSRWYGLHTVGLPLVLVALVGVPLLAVRLRKGRAAEEDAEAGTAKRTYYPYHMSREMLCAVLAVVAACGLAITLHTPVEGEATSANLSGYQALAEWYVIPLHALTGLPPFNNVTLEPVATILLPGALVTLLALLPFLERTKMGVAARRLPIPIAAFTLVACTGLYAYTYFGERTLADEHQKQVDAALGILNPPLNAQLADAGAKLFVSESCDSCHAIKGKGGTTGPELTGEGRVHSERDWQVAHLIKPASKSPGSTMPSYGSVKPPDLKALAEYMVSLH